MNTEQMLGLTINELTAGFGDGKLSPVEVMQAVLVQIRRLEPSVNAFVVGVNEDELMEQAELSTKRWSSGKPLGLLDGVPLVIKDAIMCRGWPNRLGSRVTATAIVHEDAPSVARVREAGAIILGKTTTPEFGWKGVTDSPLTGTTRNPWNLALTPGGSSGGAAAAVAAGMAYGAIGTDAAGSVRIPAAFCGLVGLKATRGRIATYPPSALWTLGHIGPITRDTRDAALMLRIIGRADDRDWSSLPDEDVDYLAVFDRPLGQKLRVAYSPALGHARVDSQVADAVRRVAGLVEDLGAEVDEIDAPLMDAREHFRAYFAAGLCHSLRHLSEADRECLDPGLCALLARHAGDDRERFLKAYDFQIQLTREARLFHAQYDFLLTPTMATPPFMANLAAPKGYDEENWLDWSPFTYPFNLTGQPAISIPCGLSREGIPLAAQLVGGLYDDGRLLRFARAIERAQGQSVYLAPCLRTA